MEGNKDGTQFVFSSVMYSAVRDSLKVELKDAVAEFNIFEDITKPYLTAMILIGDDTGIMDDIKVKGDETITLLIAKNPKLADPEPYFRLDFKVVSILREEKTADRAAVLSMNLISVHAYNNQVVKISKSYTGKLEEISKSILRNFLEVEVSMEGKYYDNEQGSEQEPIKVVIPYLSPLECVEWFTERATDRWGSPFFMWASIWGQNFSDTTTLRLGNFVTMITEGVTALDPNSDTATSAGDFVYSQVQTNLRSPDGYQGAGRIIKNIDFSNIENTLKMIREGAVGSTISNLDTYTGQDISKMFSIEQLLTSLNGGEREEGKFLRTVYDKQDQLRIGDLVKPTAYFSARQRSTVTSYGTYSTVNSIHDAIDEGALLNKVRPLSIKSMLARNMLEITIDGFGILEDRLSVGDVIRVRFATEDLDSRTLSSSNLERSGFYLIQNCRHLFSRERHDAVLLISKVVDTDIVNDDSQRET